MQYFSFSLATVYFAVFMTSTVHVFGILTGFSLFMETHIECKDKRHYGYVSDGGWDVCVSEPFRPKTDDCLVYSFGSVYRLWCKRSRPKSYIKYTHMQAWIWLLRITFYAYLCCSWESSYTWLSSTLVIHCNVNLIKMWNGHTRTCTYMYSNVHSICSTRVLQK